MSNPINSDVINFLNANTYSALLDIEGNYNFTPSVPIGYLKIHEVVLGPSNYYTTNSFLTGYTGYNISGLALTSSAETIAGELTGGRIVNIAPGYITTNISNTPATEIETLIFSAYTDLPNGVAVTSSSWANEFLRTNAVWSSSNPQTHVFDDQKTGVNFPYDGYYTIDLAADNWAELLIDGVGVASTANSFKNDEEGGTPAGSVRTQVYLTAGTKTVRVTGRNRTGDGANPGLQDSNRGVACRIRFVWDGVDNINPNPGWEIVQLERNEKDGFNFIYDFPSLPRNTYTVRIKRLTADNTSSGKTQFAHKAYLYAITATDSETAPLNKLPVRNRTADGVQVVEQRNLARTAIVVQSTNKVNGTLEGVNALVQTIALDWNSSTSTWISRTTSNPASLFRHVLQHTANTYPVSNSELDLITLQEWHEFCDLITATKPKFEYNNVLNSTQSLMEVLKDIAAAGMASPTFINGKWSVVIDKPRSYTVQHFTPHNSWGFSSTKNLVFIPDAFRITYPNEQKAYQADEVIVYNYGYGETDGYIVTAGNFIATRSYKITYLGTTNWNTVANTSNIIYKVGDTINASVVGTGTGRAFSSSAHTANGTTIRAVSTAQKFEQLSLPGVTSADQVRYFARWHLAQLKLRPEVYTLNADFEYLVCTRGDLVKVTHDVPLWGSGTARIKNISGSVITLTERILLNSSKTYQIQIRTNTKNSNQIITVTSAIQSVTSSDYYDTITATGSISGAEIDNLIMIGETNKVSQDLVVLAVQPSGNTSATLTLADYSAEIYTKDLDAEHISFNANITLENIDIVKTTILLAPKIIDVVTSSGLSEQISTGNFVNTTTITFNNPADLPKTATTIEVEVIAADNLFDPNTPKNPYYTDKQSSSILINGLTTDGLYKVRARYTNAERSIFGPWSDEYGFKVVGKSKNGFAPNNLQITLEGTNIVVKPILATGVTVPADHKTYEFRLYRSSVGITNNNSQDQDIDFWDTSWDATNMLKAQSRTQAVFNLLDLPSSSTNRRISASGIDYRIACRALNNTDNYSATSVLGSIKIKTIQ